MLGFLAGQTMLLTHPNTGLLKEWQTLLIAVAVVPVTTFVISRIWVFQSGPDNKPKDEA